MSDFAHAEALKREVARISVLTGAKQKAPAYYAMIGAHGASEIAAFVGAREEDREVCEQRLAKNFGLDQKQAKLAAGALLGALRGDLE